MSRPVAIIGAGIGGLTAALCLARRGFEVDIIERATALTEVGAGLQLSPNASRILIELGLLAELESYWSEPERIGLVDGQTLRPLASVSAGAFARRRWQAPYAVMHRASLQKVLLAAVESEARCRLHLGCPIDAPDEQVITAVTERIPDIIIGADGIWSRLRNSVPGAGRVRFSGNVAWRMTIARDTAAGLLEPDQVTAFLGPRAHLVAYPLREVEGYNLVAIIEGKETDAVWVGKDSDERRHDCLNAFSGWNADIRSLLDTATAPTYWPLCTVADGAWQDGRKIVLIGDAAHAMTPFAAQGAAMAIEDAFELADCLSTSIDVAMALKKFETARRPRIARVRRRAAFNHFAYHARGPLRIGRDIALKLKGPEALAADLDWLYGYGAANR
ncbi:MULTISPECIES: FAD-dependent monooxygenase [unclassified Ensifer]|uniref:FAD-dependent monooxygenase n=1 Tax=unclassified Ensifer TaxID=2633371 RepID=UPI000813B44C|nr:MULTISPECIES: FAD-dependent monooxygenase [unclassified Ensifer]OCP00912.1 salicylate hydroxylase [Ensifer sp. LC11]OCP01481.1 salicylate hydroxylase [Ensifer sp. LC13]OCP02029.1 salicylate hydroxylase [Ensifer sp. LC14]OCP30139.1 salicylate hydroxylase [Ensifer sp. LC499]